MNKTKILLVGCGKMGSALLNGWLSSGVKPANITVVEPNADIVALQNLQVNILEDNNTLGEDFDFCVFAVKPQNFDEIIRSYNFLSNGKCVFISIAAGKSVDKMLDLLGENAPIARAMPNLPATVLAGISAIYFNSYVVFDKQKQVVELFKSIGEVLTIKDESQIDIVTAISGSGPAYVFAIIEAMSNAGIQLGLDSETALLLSKHTVSGSGKLALTSEKSPTQLRIDVTSPGGTTEAALKVLMGDKKLENLLFDAIKAAVNRAKELQ